MRFADFSAKLLSAFFLILKNDLISDYNASIDGDSVPQKEFRNT